jgi:hypothetical protein
MHKAAIKFGVSRVHERERLGLRRKRWHGHAAKEDGLPGYPDSPSSFVASSQRADQ